MDSYQEAEWRKAQAIDISCDLVAAAKYQLAFLALVDQYPCLYQGPAVERAIYRYEQCWLPLLANAEAEAELAPPLDCEWVWHCHRLNPLQYTNYCQKFYGRLLVLPTASLPAEKDSAMDSTAKQWEKAYPNEPFSLDMDAFSSTGNNRISTPEHWLAETISSQRSFFRQVSSPYMLEESFLRAVEERYRGYLYLTKESKSFHVPTYDIELIWRSHQLNPLVYARDTVKLLGEVLQHHNTTSTTTAKLPETSKQWENTFGRRYLRAGAMGMHTAQQPPYAKESMQVMLEIVRARHLTKEKGSLFVRYHIETSGGVITMNSKEVSATSDPEWREAVSLECKGNGSGTLVSQLESQFLVFEMRWRSHGLWGKMKGGSKLVGSVRIAWKDLLGSSSLSMEKWFPLEVRGELKDDRKPPGLHLALSVTPPISMPLVENTRNGSKTCSIAEQEDSRAHVMGNSSSSERIARRRRMEREECSCRGQICNGHSFEGVFASAMSFRDAAWGV
ncbi:hypothetical protein KI387_031094 [Taxus chinensis]|uniref:C2 domain-containing protein n=1 Tax=Taxus chinensis TaxID=29808 RepID=A0AA38FF26_TAXCH|nr:hypothetical protein KI387_031094 [Taxus chinensis]